MPRLFAFTAWFACFFAEFRKVVEEYVADEDLFFNDFAAAFAKLLSLGTPNKPAGVGGGGILGLLNSLLAMVGLGGK